MNNLTIEEFDVQALVESIGHPIVNTRPKMFKFLRAIGALNGMTPNAVLERRGILWAETRNVTQGVRSKPFQKVLFSEFGREWVVGSLRLYYGNEADIETGIPKRRTFRRAGWEPFAARHAR